MTSLSEQIITIKTANQLNKFIDTLNLTKVVCLKYNSLYWLYVNDDFIQLSINHGHASKFEYTRRYIDSDDKMIVVGTSEALFNKQGLHKLLDSLNKRIEGFYNV